MKIIISEYSLAVMYIIVVLGMLGVIMATVNNPTVGAVTVYNTNMVYANDLFDGETLSSSLGHFDDVDAARNTAETVRKAYFKSTSTSADDYIISVPVDASGDMIGVTSGMTYAEALNMFSAKGTLHLETWNGSSYSDVGLPSDIELVITKYEPPAGGVDAVTPTEEVWATDKFGNWILNDDGSHKTVSQVAFNETVYTRDNIGDLTINWDTACRFRVLFRYTTGENLKTEYSAMFANKVRPSEIIYEEIYEEWVYPD